MRASLRLLAICTLVLTTFTAQAQEEGYIVLRNPSFEDMPRNSAPPTGWINCGFPGESPPDVHPDPQFEFRVSKPAQDGETYLGMVTRENETYESVGQQLTSPFVAEQCYAFSIQLARSEVYLSRSRKTNQPSNYVTPIKLMVYGGYSICDRRQLLGQSNLVNNYDWQEYRFRLSPKEDFTHIIFVAYYKQPSMFPYNGNILLDNAQPFRPIPCDQDVWIDPDVSEDPVSITNPEDRIKVTKVPPTAKGDQPEPTPPIPPTVVFSPPKDTVRIGNSVGFLEEGSIFAIEDITFKANSAELEDASQEALEQVVGFLKSNQNVIVEIGGHASTRASAYTANTLSVKRADSVVSYLLGRSIGPNRVIPEGYGNSRPVCRNDSDPDCNRRNQRVEVKILKIKTK